MTHQSLGTDFALQFARSVFCARRPETERMLDEVMAFLNDKHREYATGTADYNWSLLADNCVHTLRNAVAAANVWSPLSVQTVKLLHLFNLAVPANEFVNLAELGTEGNIENYRQIEGDGPQRDALHEFGWLPTRHGALLKTLPCTSPTTCTTRPSGSSRCSLRSGWARRDTPSSCSRTRASWISRPNLRYFRNRYRAILTVCRAPGEDLATVRGTPYRWVERLHCEYVEAQLAEVDDMLTRVEGAKRAAQ